MPFLHYIVLVFFISGCATYTDDFREVRNTYRAGNYESSLSILDKSEVKKQKRNRLLFLMEKASVLDRLGRFKQARNYLFQADRLVDELYTVSITKTAATLVYNESASDYAGEDYEKVAIHTLLALGFLEQENLKSALIEARKINTRLNEINSKYDEKKNQYGEDAFARYLAGTIHEAKGDLDAAIVDYTRAMKAYDKSYSRLFSTGVPQGLVESLYFALKKRRRTSKVRQLEKKYPSLKKLSFESSQGSVVVIHELDTIAIKREHSHVITFGDQVVRLSFPIIRPRSPGRFRKTGVELGGKFHRGELVQNLDKIASITLEDRRGRLILKQGARLLIKGQMVQKAKEEFGPIGGIAANIYGAVSESADTRGWSLLPSGYYITRVWGKPGKKEIKVYSNGRVSQIKDVTIKKGGISFVRDRAL